VHAAVGILAEDTYSSVYLASLTDAGPPIAFKMVKLDESDDDREG